MILADTSEWIELLRGRNTKLANMLAMEQVLMHPAVLGELSLGTLANRKAYLSDCSTISPAPVIEDEIVLKIIEEYELYGRGIGWVDCHLLASAKMMEVELWTQDKALHRAWEKVRRS